MGLTERLKNVSELMRDELDHKMNLEETDNMNITEAFEDVLSIQETHNYGDLRLWNECKQIMIDVDYVLPIDISKIFVTSGKRYWFKLKGIHYDYVNKSL